MIRLYGYMEGSFRTVSLGMERAIQHHGKLSGFVPSEDIGEDDLHVGVEAPVALSVGVPMRALKAHVKGQHKSHWVLLAPNSNGIPPEAVRLLKGETFSLSTNGVRRVLDGVIAPSVWAQKVLQDIFPDIPVILWQHGVLPHFQVQEETRSAVRQMRAGGQMNFLHMTSTKMSRKGTKELLVAWSSITKAYPDLRLQLELLVNPANSVDYLEMVKELQARNVAVIPGQNFTDKRLVAGMSRYHGVLQPSRAEGFGLVPLEARACGIPVAMTDNTGHADHANGPGVVTIPSGELQTSDDYFRAQAPIVSPEDIFRGVSNLIENWEVLEAAAVEYAPVIQNEWSWENRASSPLEELEKYV